jgi:hypothetical protein
MNWRSCAENRDMRTWGFESSLVRIDHEAGDLSAALDKYG